MAMIRLGAIGLLVSTTIGAGIFSLPYVSQQAGWATFLIYLIGIGALLAFVHAAYGEALDRVPGHHRLTGLVQLYLPRRAFPLGALSVLGGLALTLVVYLILASTFTRVVAPGVSYEGSVFFMWAAGSLPLLLRLRRMVALEFAGALAMGAIILFIAADAAGAGGAFFSGAPFVPGNALLPFAPVLFALAAWNAIGPMRDYERKIGVAHTPRMSSVAWGTAIAALLYAAFAVGIVASAGAVTPDTLSGLANWDPLKRALLGAFGLIALWTSYVPVAAEARDSLERDFKWSQNKSAALVIAAPLALMVFGLTSFLKAVELAGGVFLSAQYIFICLVTLRAVPMPRAKRGALRAAAALFSLAAVYELYRFIVS